jgi:hypothetical protein
MDLRTLYFVGQRVFFAQLGVIEEVEIKEIYLTVSERGTEYHFETRYLVRDKFFATFNVDEKELFSSKKELLNALAGDEFVVVPLKD